MQINTLSKFCQCLLQSSVFGNTLRWPFAKQPNQPQSSTASEHFLSQYQLQCAISLIHFQSQSEPKSVIFSGRFQPQAWKQQFLPQLWTFSRSFQWQYQPRLWTFWAWRQRYQPQALTVWVRTRDTGGHKDKDMRDRAWIEGKVPGVVRVVVGIVWHWVS